MTSIQGHLRQRRQQAAKPASVPIKTLTEDERQALFADIRANTAARLARLTAGSRAARAVTVGEERQHEANDRAPRDPLG